MVVLGDINAHADSKREGFEECLGRFGKDDQNAEVYTYLRCAVCMVG